MSKKNQKNPSRNIYKINLAACILFYEKLDQTIECIKSILPSGIKIYILNNGSTLASANALKSFCKKYDSITIFDSVANLGVASGRNFLLNHTSEEWLLFIDNDIRIKTKEWFKRLENHISKNQDIEVLIPKLFNLPEREYSSNLSLIISNGFVRRNGEINNGITNVFPGGASFIRKSLFNRLGEYDEKMFVGFEDYEFSIRGLLCESPVKALCLDDVEFIHEHRKVTKSEDRNAVRIRYDYNQHRTSHDRITEKYQLILDEGDFKSWTEGQIKKLLEKDTFSPLKYLIRIFK
ncbi:glycosyltransferase [Candidatus Pacearchaeota archaeon]|nr:glycosyltransferase [Candidatus Pacearchaeota archaeon]